MSADDRRASSEWTEIVPPSVRDQGMRLLAAWREANAELSGRLHATDLRVDQVLTDDGACRVRVLVRSSLLEGRAEWE